VIPLEDLDQAGRRLIHEIRVMAAMCATAVALQEREPILTQGCLDACLVRLRLLIEFFAGRPRRKGGRKWRPDIDIVPQLFVPDWIPVVDRRFDAYLERLDQHVAHLSLERIGRADPQQWALERMVGVILREFERFCAEAVRIDCPLGPQFVTAFRQAAYLAEHPPTEWPPGFPSDLG
jgi:hypothetical protein